MVYVPYNLDFTNKQNFILRFYTNVIIRLINEKLQSFKGDNILLLCKVGELLDWLPRKIRYTVSLKLLESLLYKNSKNLAPILKRIDPTLIQDQFQSLILNRVFENDYEGLNRLSVFSAQRKDTTLDISTIRSIINCYQTEKEIDQEALSRLRSFRRSIETDRELTLICQNGEKVNFDQQEAVIKLFPYFVAITLLHKNISPSEDVTAIMIGRIWYQPKAFPLSEGELYVATELIAKLIQSKGIKNIDITFSTIIEFLSKHYRYWFGIGKIIRAIDDEVKINYFTEYFNLRCYVACDDEIGSETEIRLLAEKINGFLD
ncbi:MAG: hypothetical protein H6779_01260 [Candidatus Nomurabacteria bacterium]|nr:MAG: hypothetical protein H6779_01260 [Candidatus Nomurabacteria bacterium]